MTNSFSALLFARFTQKLRQYSMFKSSLPTFFKILKPSELLFPNSYKVSLKLARVNTFGESTSIELLLEEVREIGLMASLYALYSLL